MMALQASIYDDGAHSVLVSIRVGVPWLGCATEGVGLKGLSIRPDHQNIGSLAHFAADELAIPQ